MEERSSSTTLKQFIWGRYIDECVQLKTLTTAGPQSLPAGDYYPLQDLLYRTTALTDDQGSVVEAYDYDAYGNTLIFSAAGTGGNWWADDAVQANYAVCDVLYCGYRYDPELQAYQIRNREYNPALGRWLQRDSIGFAGGDWNLYKYTGNNPLIYMDYTGLQTFTCQQTYNLCKARAARAFDACEANISIGAISNDEIVVAAIGCAVGCISAGGLADPVGCAAGCAVGVTIVGVAYLVVTTIRQVFACNATYHGILDSCTDAYNSCSNDPLAFCPLPTGFII